MTDEGPEIELFLCLPQPFARGRTTLPEPAVCRASPLSAGASGDLPWLPATPLHSPAGSGTKGGGRIKAAMGKTGPVEGGEMTGEGQGASAGSAGATERQKRILRGDFTDINISTALNLLEYGLDNSRWQENNATNTLTYTGPGGQTCIFKLQNNRLTKQSCSVVGMDDL